MMRGARQVCQWHQGVALAAFLGLATAWPLCARAEEGEDPAALMPRPQAESGQAESGQAYTEGEDIDPAALSEVIAADAAAGVLVAVPSGLAVRWVETLRDAAGPAGLTLRFRFVAPALAETVAEPEALSADMQALCDGFVLERLPNIGPRPAQVVITLSDRLVPFGEVDEGAVQFFEAYSVGTGACEWELY